MKCLVRKLGSAVENDNLPYFNKFVINTVEYSSAANRAIEIDAAYITKVTVGDAVFCTSTDISTSKGQTLDWTTRRYVLSPTQSAKCTIEVNPSKNFTKLWVGADFKFSIDHIVENSLVAIGAGSSTTPINVPHVIGDIASMKGSYGTLTELALQGANITGTTTALGKFTMLSRLNITGCAYITGTILEMAESMRVNGRAAGVVNYRGNLASVTFDGIIPLNDNVSGYTGVIEWGNGFVYVKNPTAKKVFCKGCSQSQISAWQSEGYVVTSVS